MAKRIYANKEGFTSINLIRDFLYGLKNTKNSKVFLRIEQKNGYNYLCVYLDNNYEDERGELFNGFRQWFQLEMNKVEE